MKPNWDIEIIKIKNFKSYNETTYIGPFHFLTGIFGRNGSGKTNLVDGIIFSLGKEICKTNSTVFKNLPSGFRKKKEHIESRVGVVFSKKNEYLELSRTIDNFNVSEYFIRGVKVSLDLYQKIIRLLGCNFSELVVLKNPSRNKFFLDPFFLSDFIDRISGSKKLTLLHLKISILKKKLQENCSYFFYKLSFINKQKTIIINKQKNLINMKKKRANLQIWNFVKYKKKIFSYSQKLWKCSRNTEKSLRKFKEIEKKKFLTEYSLLVDTQNFKSKTKMDQKIKENLKFYFKSQKFGKRINVLTSEIVGKFSEKFLTEVFLLIKRKNKKNYLLNFTHTQWNWEIWFYQELNENKERKYLRKNLFFLFLFSKFFFLRIYQNKAKNLYLPFIFPKTVTRYSKKINCKSKLLKIKSYIFLGQTQRFFFNIFYFSICLIFILIAKKNETKEILPTSFLNGDKGLFLSLRSEIRGIRGKISELIKPLDSKFRIKLLPFFERKKNIVLLDNQSSIKRSLEFLKKKKKCFYSFLPINSLQRKYIIERKNKKRIQLTRLFDFDIYDYPGIEVIFEEILFFSDSKKIGKSLVNEHFKQNSEHDILISKKEYEVISYNPLSSQDKMKTFEIVLGFESQKKKFKKLFHRKIFQEKTRENFFFDWLENTTNQTTNWNFFKRESFYFLIFYYKNFKKVLKNYRIFLWFLKKQLRSFIQSSLVRRNFYFFKKNQSHKPFSNKFKASVFLRFNWRLENFLDFFSSLNFSFLAFSNNMFSFFFPKKLDLNLIAKKNNLIAIKNSIITRKKNFIRNKFFSYFSIFIQTFLVKNFSKIKENHYRISIPQKIFSLIIFYHSKKRKETFLSRENIKFLKLHLVKQFSHSGGLFFFPKPKKIFGSSWLKKNISFFFQTLRVKLDYEKEATFREVFFTEYLSQYLSDYFEPFKIEKKLNFIQERLRNIKNELKKNRHRFYITNSKFYKVSSERKRRFLICIEEVSVKINSLYKELTSSTINPLGGTAFFSISNNKCPFFGKVLYFAVPPFKKFNEIKNLSGGEKTIASFVLIFCLSMKVSPPFAFFDEIDSNLDNWNSVKLFNFLVKLAGKKIYKIGIISFKMRFYFFFRTILYVYLNKKGSNLVTLNSGI